ncbi:hypothetical protein GHW74_09835 [Salmonella enterica]|nr:hypothetical protein [Salmonella enterica]EDN1989295.1 hypothetical protein [Salmonella enterica]EDY1292501.1 hypothetical protein [Salmonella enterica]EDY7556162.1 hypothetical protein [Salmonella enterica]EEG2924820.1 hypothetical protein [Salmonella enterica]
MRLPPLKRKRNILGLIIILILLSLSDLIIFKAITDAISNIDSYSNKLFSESIIVGVYILGALKISTTLRVLKLTFTYISKG